jgi:hypothetical protein
MGTLTRDQRRRLETTVREARRVAEDGAAKSLNQFAVGHAKVPSSFRPEQAKLRAALRAHGRQLGDLRNAQTDVQEVVRLTIEVAYEHWHRMMFARFLAENDLLIEPESRVAISLADCQELAREKNTDWLVLASSYAQSMLPQIFRAGDPVLDISLPLETRSKLEDLLKALPREIFIADDSLGWVYQFWQADNKDAVNRSEKKIGAEELPAVTQLFTEDYMVWFLLHNTLGAWWAGKVLAKNPVLATTAKSEEELHAACAVRDIDWKYLRFVRNDDQSWCPAAGTFDGWPKQAKDITLLDPCMGSGHFLVFALPMLAAMRVQEEGLKPDAAIEGVLRDNLYGLELDPRCTQIAAFNLALAAWKRVGFRQLPTLHLACSGLSLGVSKSEWLKLAERAAAELPVPPERDLLGTKEENLFSDATRRGFERLYELFAKAPTLGSLIQPRASGDLIEKGFTDLEPLLARVMAKADSVEVSEMAVAAQGLAKAAQILASQFTLVATNVPYLGRGKHDDALKTYCELAHPTAKTDLATCLVERCMGFCVAAGAAALVTPQNWWFASSYVAFRKRILQSVSIKALATLGEEAWQSFGERGPVAGLMVLETRVPTSTSRMIGVDALPHRLIEQKQLELQKGLAFSISQDDQFANPDHRIIVGEPTKGKLLKDYARSYQGIKTGDDARYCLQFWELPQLTQEWKTYQGGISVDCDFGGMDMVLRWNNDGEGLARKQGQAAWTKCGALVSQMRTMPVTRYFGDVFASSVSPIVADDDAHVSAIWMYCSSREYRSEVRKIDRRVCVTTSSLVNVPFDLGRWQKIAAEKYPDGLPTPYSFDPTQWLFAGRPNGSDQPLHVAVARLLGYHWPRQTGSCFPDCPALEPDGFNAHADDDGIVPFTAIKGESSARERLVELLAAAYDEDWSSATLNSLLAAAGHAGLSLDDWLRDHFFEEHCALFHQRPFIWQIWDGRPDGFNVLVNYHCLAAGNGEGHRLLSKLIYTYLGDWIDRQRADQKAGIEGADARLAAAQHLKTVLEKILEGEPPYDIFVRWKPLGEQPIGWEADINDGVCMNIRPFMTARPYGARARNACILRVTPKIDWDKDRGKEPLRSVEHFPWFWGWDQAQPDFRGGKVFDGNRWNDLHYSTEVKKRARDKSDGR